MSDKIPYLSPGEIERLALVAEECGEVLQAIGKVLRHGYESRHPNGGPTNRETLEREIGDLEAALDILSDHDLRSANVASAMRAKFQNVGKYLHHTTTRTERHGDAT